MFIAIIALLIVAVFTSFSQLVWTSPHTTIVFGQGGIKVNRKVAIFPGETVTDSRGVRSSGWSVLRNSQYTFDYFLAPAWRRGNRETRVILPYWPFLLALAAPWFILHRKARRRRRHVRAGCCEHCGYNLKGLASDRCPECGQQHDRIP